LYSQRELQNIRENYFKEIADTYKIEIAFLYGSWARGYQIMNSIGILESARNLLIIFPVTQLIVVKK